MPTGLFRRRIRGDGHRRWPSNLGAAVFSISRPDCRPRSPLVMIPASTLASVTITTPKDLLLICHSAIRHGQSAMHQGATHRPVMHQVLQTRLSRRPVFRRRWQFTEMFGGEERFSIQSQSPTASPIASVHRGSRVDGQRRCRRPLQLGASSAPRRHARQGCLSHRLVDNRSAEMKSRRE